MLSTAKTNRLKSVTALLLLLTLLTGIFSPATVSAAAMRAEPPEFQSDIVYMVDMKNGRVLIDQNSTKQNQMASLTKITSVSVALNLLSRKGISLDSTTTVTQAALNEIKDPQSASAGLTAGEILTYRQLINLCLIKSANEATLVLAHSLCGNTAAFVAEMNSWVRSLGCQNTNYVNTHGLTQSGHYTTARDLYTITMAALKNSVFKSTVQMTSYELPPTNKRETSTLFKNSNFLIRPDTKYYIPGVKGVKTGYTETAGRCLVSYIEKNGRQIMLITIGGRKTVSQDNKYAVPFEDAKLAYDWVFNS